VERAVHQGSPVITLNLVAVDGWREMEGDGPSVGEAVE